MSSCPLLMSASLWPCLIFNKKETRKMEKKSNKFIAVSYKLYTIDADGTNTMVEEAPAAKPFQFISGFGITLDAFENALVDLEKGADFDFVLSEDEAYGPYVNEHVIALEKEMFMVNGRFDKEYIFKGAVVPLQNEQGQRFMATVVDIADDKVTLDLNHPLAGKKLNFKGSVVENREASNEEIQTMINHMSGEGCGHCGGDCGGCGGHEGHEGGCCGHGNHEGGCCGHKH